MPTGDPPFGLMLCVRVPVTTLSSKEAWQLRPAGPW
jgi:hypothetical protein